MNGRKKVLFVCLGNACRSQMAEGFAKTYGRDVLEPISAGFAPASMIPDATSRTMLEKNIRLEGQFPKPLSQVEPRSVDVIVNLCGYPLPESVRAITREWPLPDPIGESDDVYRQVRDEIERRVMGLILELRRQQKAEEAHPRVTQN